MQILNFIKEINAEYYTPSSTRVLLISFNKVCKNCYYLKSKSNFCSLYFRLQTSLCERESFGHAHNAPCATPWLTQCAWPARLVSRLLGHLQKAPPLSPAPHTPPHLHVSQWGTVVPSPSSSSNSSSTNCTKPSTSSSTNSGQSLEGRPMQPRVCWPSLQKFYITSIFIDD